MPNRKPYSLPGKAADYRFLKILIGVLSPTRLEKNAGISRTDGAVYRTLLYLSKEYLVTTKIVAIAKEACVPRTSVHRSLNNLEDAGLISRCNGVIELLDLPREIDLGKPLKNRR